VDRDVERAEPHFLYAGDIVRVEIGKGDIVAMEKREAIVLILEVETLSQAGWVLVYETEYTSVPTGARLHGEEGEAHRLMLLTLDHKEPVSAS